MKSIPIVTEGFPFNDNICPADQHFIEYLEGRPSIHPIAIFHLGSGLSHRIGLWAAKQENVFVRSISITPPEITEYIRLAIENPMLNSKYLVDFGDIHLLNPYLLPRFDYIALFHLGEICTQVSDPEYPGKSISDVIDMLSRQLSIKGKMLFYEGSAGWNNIKTHVEINLSHKYAYDKSNYKSLVIYTR